jgi:hypothetical protein
LILIGGGLFLLAKSTLEIHDSLEIPEHDSHKDIKAVSFTSVLLQIAIIDMVFSLDSVITAVGLVEYVSIMVIAIVIAVGVMLMSAATIGNFVDDNPTIKMLALSFLILIGMTLVGEGLDAYIAIPLDRIPTGQLQLIMFINRIEGRFILDTGATATTLDSKSKIKFRITSRAFGGVVAGAGGAGMTLEKVNPPYRIELGEIRIQGFDLYVTNLDHVNDTFENMGISPVDGVVGADLLTTMNGIIDYCNLVLYLLEE